MQLHFATTFLDPTLREFRFCPIAKDRQLFRQQAINCIRAFVRPINQLLAVEEDGSNKQRQTRSDEDDRGSEGSASLASTQIGTAMNSENVESIPRKHSRFDIFARFRDGSGTCESTSSQGDSDVQQNLSDEEMSLLLDQDLARYEDLKGPFVISASQNLPGQSRYGKSSTLTNQDTFNPLAWWGAEKYRFPYLSKVAKQLLVIQGSSSESERHFSTAGKIARKDRARLHSSTVEAQVLLAEGIKKNLI